MKIEEELVKCDCECHTNPGIMHMVACCEGGFRKQYFIRIDNNGLVERRIVGTLWGLEQFIKSVRNEE